jgi:filamentous hemagglutinin family protein
MTTRRLLLLKKAIAVFAAHCLLGSNIVLSAGQIITDGRTQTTLAVQGNVTDVTTATIRGRNAYNSFHKFDVYRGNVVNLQVPTTASNLLNLVHDQASRIDGTLNAYKDGSIGGNVYFANPHGIVVGRDGVVNVGSLHATTPTPGYMRGFFDGQGNPSSLATQQMLSGAVPVNPDATIAIEGRVNARGDVELRGGQVLVSGQVGVEPPPIVGDQGFDALVNTEGLESGVALVERNGEILIVGSGDVGVSGELAADGSAGLDAGAVVVRAGQDLQIEPGARLSASGQGKDSDGGSVDLYAERDATFTAGASVAAAGGNSGDGGSIELSAGRKVTLAGGDFDVRAPRGNAGAVLIDPLVIEATTGGTIVRGGSVKFQADDAITVKGEAILSSRDVGDPSDDTDYETDSSQDNSGDITLDAPSITLEPGSKLLAHATDGFEAGDILLKAEAVDHHPDLSLQNLGLIADATGKIVVDGAILKGADITLEVSADALYDWKSLVDVFPSGETREYLGKAIDFLKLEEKIAKKLPINAGLAIARGTAELSIKGKSELDASGNLQLSAQSDATSSANRGASADALKKGTFGLSLLYSETKAHATIDIESEATIHANQLTVDARNTADLDTKVFAFSKGDAVEAALGWAHSDIHSHAQIASGADIDVAGTVSVSALNNSSFNSSANATALDAGKAGIAAMVVSVHNTANAQVDADLAGIERLVVQALDQSQKKTVLANAQAGSEDLGLIDEAKNYASEKVQDFVRSLLGKVKKPDERSGAESKPKLAGAFTYAKTQQTADASIGDGAEIQVGGPIVIDARVVDASAQLHAKSEVASEAKNPTAGDPTATKALSLAVTYADLIHDANAHLGENAIVDAQNLAVEASVGMPWVDEWQKGEGLPIVLDKLKIALDKGSDTLTGYSNAASEAEDLNLAGAINLLDFTSDVRAYVGKGAQITIRSDVSAEWQQDLAVGDVDDDQQLIWTNEEKQWSADVAVLADNQVQGAFSAGNVGSSLFATGAGDEGKSLGASYNHVTYDITTLAYLAEGSSLTSTDEAFDLAVRATSSENLMSLAPTAGKGGSYGLNGVFSLATIDNTTEASIDDEAIVDTAGGRIEINAEDEVISWSLAGAVNKSESAAVGVGIALADVITDTRAFVGDNDVYYKTNENPSGSKLSINGSVTAGSLDITARTDGRIETIAVAGSYSSSSDPDRPTSRRRSNAVVEDTRTKWQKAKTWLKGKFSSGGSSTQTSPEYGYGVSGAIAWNEVALDTRAFAKDSTLTLTNGDLLISAINDTDIGAISGSAALVRANAKSVERSGGFAGALAVNDLENETLAELLGTKVLDIANAQLLALAGGEQLAIAIGAAINNSAQQDKAASAAGSVSVSKTDNRVAVTADGSTLTGDGSADVEFIAYDRTRLGTGGGSLSVGGNKGFGAAITYSEIANTVEAVISATTISGFANAVLHAWSNARIAAGGAMGGFTNAEAEGTLGGAIVITEIDNTTKAVIDNGSDVALDSTLSVLARDTEPVAELDDQIDSRDDGNPNSVSLDYDGETFGEESDPGSSILSVAGVLQAGANNIGLSFAYSDIDNTFTAAIDDANVTVTAGDVEVRAVSTARIRSFAVGVGVAKDEFAGGGSVTLNEIDNTVTATVDQAVVDSDGLTVSAGDASHIGSLAGQVTISTGSKAIGAAAAYNEIGNQVTASVDGIALDNQALTVVDADNAATIRTLSATAGGAEDFAFNGAWSNAAIDNTTEAALLDAEAANDGDLGDLEVTATDASTIESLSGGAALATKGAGVGAALATNRIDNTTKAHVSGTPPGRTLYLENLIVRADSTSDIETLGIGLGGGDKVGVGGSVVTNFVDNDVEAYIDDGAQVMADDNVGVLAQSDDRITMAAGSAGIGLESAGVGASVSVNKISGDTKAYIAGPDTAVTAKGLDASNTLTIFPGELEEDVDLATSIDVDTYNSLALRDEMVTEEVTGLAVNASATQHVENIDVNVTGSAKFAGGVTVNVNRISGTTEAYIDSAATDGGGDLNVIAANHAYGNGFVGNLAVSGVSSIGAATDIHSIDRTTSARVTDGDIKNAGAVTVKALATQGVSSAAIGGAVGIGNWSFAGTGSVAKFGGTTEAYLDSTDVTADSLTVVADSTNRMHLVGGAVSAAGGVGIGGTFTLGISDTTTRAYVQGEAGTAAHLTLTGPLEINAKTDNEFTSYAVGGALAGGAGYAGAAAVNLVTNTTEAWLRDADVGSSGARVGAVTVRAENRVDIENSAGALGIGLSGLGLGAGANVSILKSRVASEIDQSRVHSDGTVAVEAENTSLLDSESRMAGVGGTAGIGGAAVIALVGDDLQDAAADELDSGGDGTLSQLQTSVDGEDLAAVDNDEALSADERTDMEATGDHGVSDVAYGTDSQGYRYQTTARITGTDTLIDAGADTDGRGISISTIDTVQVDGLAIGVGASAGLGVGGGVAIVDLAGKSSAYVDEAALTTTGDVIIDAQGVVQDTDVTTYAGGAGAVGLGAAYIDITSTPQTTAYIGPQATIEAADHVQIGATSTSDVTAEGKGVVAGAVAVGVVIADVTDAGTTEAYVDAGARIGVGSVQVGSLDVTARSDQTLAADTGAAAGGIVAGQGSVATVEATPTVRAFVGDGAQIRVDGAVAFTAEGELDVDSTAKGITVAGAGAGVSQGTIDADPTIETSIGAGAEIEADGDILLTARRITTGLSSLATASFGGLIGAAASTATTLLSPTVGVAVGDGASLISTAGRIGLLADADNLADAFADGWVGAVAAWGSNTADARIEAAKTTAGIGKSVSLTADSIQIEALAVNDVFSDAVAGAGGVVVGASADASTRIDSETRAFIADNDAAGGSNLLTTGGDLRILADELSIFNSQSDSTAGGVVGYSGADIDDDIDALVVASIGQHTDIDSGGDVTVLARNRTAKANVGRNASAGAGGVLGLSAGDGGTVINNITKALIAGNSAGSDHTTHAGGSLAVSAESDVDSYSYGRLSAGGLIANADIEMQSTANSTTLAAIGEYASLEAGEDVDVRAHSDADVETKAHISTYGVSASGAAKAKTWIDNTNETLVAANADLYAGRDIHVTAGAGLDGLRNDLRGKAEGRSWAKGLFPSGSVTGWSTIDNVNRVNLAAGSDLQAGQDVKLGSYAGSVSTDGYAKAKKTSYALFGIPINLYSNGSRKSIHNATTTVTVDGEVQSGINHHRWLDIAFDPDAPRKLGDISGNIGFDIAEVDLRAELDAEIDALDEQIDNETTDFKVALENKRDRLLEKRYALPDPASIDRITLQDAIAEGGSVHIDGQLSGSGALRTPGNDLRIEIINDSPAHLVTNHLEIPLSSQGQITLNGRRITSHPGMTVEYGPSALPKIFIASYYAHEVDDPPKDIATEIRLNGSQGEGGDIINLAGSVVVENQFGDVTSTAKIIADTVDIAVGGDFVQEYTPGVTNSENVIAGNNISISAEVLNINGTLQSGIPYRTVVIDPFTEADIEARGGEQVIRPDAKCGGIDCNIRVVWDEEKQLIKVDPVRFGGGYIELFGEIASTGGGELKLFDGYGEVNVINNTDHDIVLRSMNIGEPVVGLARIFDTGKVHNGAMVRTDITADGIERYYRSEDNGRSVWNLFESTPRDNRETPYSYAPREGLRYLEDRGITFTNKPVTETSTHWWTSYGYTNEAALKPIWPPFIQLTLKDLTSSYLRNQAPADHPIPVTFLGRTDKGVITVVNNGRSNTLMNGALRNPSGPVTLTNDQGDIQALHDSALIAARDIHLGAPSGGIGSLEQAVNIDLGAGHVTAAALASIHLHERDGDLRIGSVASGEDVFLSADGSIIQINPQINPGLPAVIGRDIALTAINGGIGLDADALTIDSNGVLSAAALGSVYITEQSGDLRVNKVVSETGNVVLVAPGAIEDYNFFESVDQDVKERLINIWEEMELQNAGKVDDAIALYKAQKKAEYHEQHRLDDGGTVGYTGDDTFDSSYDPNYEYQLTADEQQQYNDAVWTDEELLITKNVLTVPQSANDGTLRVKTEVLIEDPNIEAAGNVVLRAGGGIGEHLGDIVITQDRIDAGDVTQDEKLAIIAAERDDLAYETDDRQLRVSKKRDFDIAAGGSIDLQARDFVFLGSETDINIARADSQTSNIRLKVSGNITNANDRLDVANLLADDLIIEAAATTVSGVDQGGNIGTRPAGRRRPVPRRDPDTARRRCDLPDRTRRRHDDRPVALGWAGDPDRRQRQLHSRVAVQSGRRTDHRCDGRQPADRRAV